MNKKRILALAEQIVMNDKPTAFIVDNNAIWILNSFLILEKDACRTK